MKACCRCQDGGDIYGPIWWGEKTENELARWICADGRQRARGKEEFYMDVLSVSCAQDTRNCSKYWLECWCRGGNYESRWFQNKINYSETGGMCWHRFLTRVMEGDFDKKKVADLKETKRWTGLESADRACPMDQKNMLWRCWFARSGARPMERCRWSQGRRRGHGLYKNLDDSVVIS